MKKNEIYNLLINTNEAKNMLHISNSSLAHILGVSTDSLQRWFSKKQCPSELNIYKLQWFVYLTQVLNTPLSYILHYYNLADMDYDHDPEGNNKHLEPWNGDYFENILDTFYFNNTDSLIIEGGPDDLDFTLPPECNICSDNLCPYTVLDDLPSLDEDTNDNSDYDLITTYYSLNEILEMPNAYDILAESCHTPELIERTFDLYNMPLSEGINRMEILRDVLDFFIDNSNDLISDYKNTLYKYYLKVRNFASFSTFIRFFIKASSFDEAYDMACGNVKVTLTFYSDDKTSVKSLDVDGVQLFNDYIKIYTDESEFTLLNDSSFSAKPITSNHDNAFFFMLKSKGKLYTLKYDFI